MRLRGISRVKHPSKSEGNVLNIQIFESPEVGRDRRAAKLLGFVDEAIKQRGKLRFYTEQQIYDKAVSALRDALGPDEVTNLLLDGSVWPEEQACADALDLSLPSADKA